jgi:phasin family protein
MMQQQQTYFLELYRAGMRAAADITKASLENAQRLHSQQVEALREATESNVQSARQLSEAKSLGDMIGLQVKLAAQQAEQAAELWTRTWRTASETQVALLGRVQTQVGELSERMRESYSAATREVAANNGIEAERKQHRKSA